MEPGRALWTLAWPVLALGLLRSAMFLADSAWVGQLGADALSGQAGASFASWILHGWGELAGIGLLALIARAVGARNDRRIQVLFTQGILLGAVLSVVAVLASGSAPALYFRLLGYVGEAFAPSLSAGEDYLTVLMQGAPTLVFFLIIHATFRAIGDTRTPLAITVVVVALNIGLDPVFMFGLGPFEALGVRGAALATVISDGIGAVIGFALLARRGVAPLLTGPDLRLIGAILRISAPMAVAGIGFSLVYVFLGPIVTAFGPEPMAALGVGHRIESVSYFFCVGVGTATATLVGQNLGASTPERAARTVQVAEKLLYKGLIPVSLVYLVAAPVLFSFFTDDPYLASSGTAYLRTVALVTIFMGWEVLFESAYSGAGDTLPPTLVTLPLTALRIPMAWALVEYTSLGLNGIWIAIAVSTVAKGIWLRAMFKRGRWKRKLGLDV
jgi:putative MATE family efflux protein